MDYSLFGHQIVCHEVKGYSAASTANAGMHHLAHLALRMAHMMPGALMVSHVAAVDGDPVPVPHFGVALTVEQFHDLAQRVEAAGIPFILQPHLRFQGASAAPEHACSYNCIGDWQDKSRLAGHSIAGQPGEQWTMFFQDPSGNSLEFKAMTNPDNLFAKYVVTTD